jgi:hypothetical protein
MEAIARRPSRKLLIVLVLLAVIVAALPTLMALGVGWLSIHAISRAVSTGYVVDPSDPDVRHVDTYDGSTLVREEWSEVKRSDGSWVKNGPSIRWSSAHAKLVEGRYANDKREGQWMFWNDVRVRPAWSITLERTISDEIRPVYKVTVTGDGSVRYSGVTFVRVGGSQTAQISTEAVSRIQQRVRGIHLFETNLQCGFKAHDGPHVVIEAMDGSRSVRFDSLWNREKEDPDASTHVAIGELADLIDEVVGTDRWIK